MLNTGKITRSSDASGQSYIQGLVPCTLQPTVRVVIRASGMREETPPSSARTGFFKREVLPAAEGPPPSLIFAREAFATRSTFESQHGT